MTDLERLKAQLDILQELLHAGHTKTLVGTYPSGARRYSYKLDDELIGAALRQKFLELSSRESELENPRD